MPRQKPSNYNLEQFIEKLICMISTKNQQLSRDARTFTCARSGIVEVPDGASVGNALQIAADVLALEAIRWAT